jgi:hypothetical protein
MFAHERSQAQLGRRISLATIDKVVAAQLGQTRVPGNAQPGVFNRQIAMYLAKHVGGWSTTQIGRFYNGRDHSTVCYAVKKIEMLRNSDSQVDELIATLKGEIGSEFQRNGAVSHNAVNHPVERTGDVLVTDEFLDLVVDRLLDRLRSPRRRIGENAILPR